MIQQLFRMLTLITMMLLSFSTMAMLNLELTRGMAGAEAIAVIPFVVQRATPPQNVSAIISNDLQNSGRFKVYAQNSTNVDEVVQGSIQSLGGDRYQVSFQLLESFKKKGGGGPAVLDKKYTVPGDQLRALAHHISDLIYQQVIGVRGVFSTKLAYVVVQRSVQGQTRYILEVCDQDGYNPRALLTSYDPIISPAWSPNGKQIAYVSFEKRRAAIYLEDVATGTRRLISEFPGINGAPAWSPDGRKLALVLSKSGSPNIYIMDMATYELTQLTHDWYINTEPAWSPNGKSLLFTSNRGGGPQIYQMNLSSGGISRITYDGSYNARASFTPDGDHIVFNHKEGGAYQIGVLDLDTGTFRALTTTGLDNDSPSIAPNGSMVLYDAIDGNRSVLAMVSTDGRVQLRLPARNGEAQDPA